MPVPRTFRTLLPVVLPMLLMSPLAARADVTIQQQSTFDFAIIKSNTSSTEYTSGEKQRRDSEMHCEGFMSMVCGNQASDHIIRLDRDVEWSLEPKKKAYQESRFPTAAEREAAAEKVRASLEKLKSCPAVQQNSSAPDTSKCDMSPPKIEEKLTDQHQTIAGHDSRLTQVALTQSCHNRETNDTCDFVIAMDSWLTQDEIAGIADRKAFQTAYLKKMGLDQMSAQVQQNLQQFLAPYKDSLKQLSAKAEDFKGYPMKTAFSISYGGAQCSAAKNAPPSANVSNPLNDAGAAATSAVTSSVAGAAGSAAGAAAANAAGNGVAGSILGSAGSAFGSKLVSGLFQKKSSATAPPPAAAPATPAPANMVRVAAMSVETKSITTDAIPADKFDVPAGWKLVTPKEKNAPEKELSCPASGT
jgi:hypothetical protein